MRCETNLVTCCECRDCTWTVVVRCGIGFLGKFVLEEANSEPLMAQGGSGSVPGCGMLCTKAVQETRVHKQGRDEVIRTRPLLQRNDILGPVYW